MKKQSFKLFALALALGLFTIMGTAGSAKAQHLTQFNVPFEFHVGKEKFPAGKYEIKLISSTVYLLRNADGSNGILVGTDMTVAQNQDSKHENLVFNRYGETYFLRRIFTKRMTDGREIGESKLEKNIRNQESNLAKNNSPKIQISINATK